MNKINKIKMLLCILLLMFSCFGLSLSFNVKADNFSLEDVNLQMEKGASIRLVSVSENASLNNGIRFQMTASKTDIDTLESNTSAQVRYGMVIAPRFYVDIKEFSLKNLFGSESVYTWDNKNDGKAIGVVKILQVEPKKEVFGDNYVFSGSVINLLEENLSIDYVARGYIEYTENEVTTYKLADYYDSKIDNNTRSMYTVAQMVMEADVETQLHKNWVKNYYIDKAQVEDDDLNESITIENWSQELIKKTAAFEFCKRNGYSSYQSIEVDVKVNESGTLNLYVEKESQYGIKIDIKQIGDNSSELIITNNSEKYSITKDKWQELYLVSNSNRALVQVQYSGSFTLIFDNITTISEAEYKNAVGNDSLGNLSIDFWSGVVAERKTNVNSVGLNGANSYQSLQVDAKLPSTSTSENMNIWLNRMENTFGYKADVKAVYEEGTTVNLQNSTIESDKGQDWTIKNFSLTNGEWATLFLGYFPSVSDKVLLQPTFTGNFTIYIDNIVPITEQEFKNTYFVDVDTIEKSFFSDRTSSLDVNGSNNTCSVGLNTETGLSTTSVKWEIKNVNSVNDYVNIYLLSTSFGCKFDLKLESQSSVLMHSFTLESDKGNDWTLQDFTLENGKWITLYLGNWPNSKNVLLQLKEASGDFTIYIDNISDITENEFKANFEKDLTYKDIITWDAWDLGYIVTPSVNNLSDGRNGEGSLFSLNYDIDFKGEHPSPSMNMWIPRTSAFGYKMDVKVVYDEGTTVSLASATQESDKVPNWTQQSIALSNNEWTTVYLGYYPSVADKVLLQWTFTGDFTIYLDNIREITEEEFKQNI